LWTVVPKIYNGNNRVQPDIRECREGGREGGRKEGREGGWVSGDTHQVFLNEAVLAKYFWLACMMEQNIRHTPSRIGAQWPVIVH
jgi:hypothetical protein